MKAAIYLTYLTLSQLSYQSRVESWSVYRIYKLEKNCRALLLMLLQLLLDAGGKLCTSAQGLVSSWSCNDNSSAIRSETFCRLLRLVQMSPTTVPSINHRRQWSAELANACDCATHTSTSLWYRQTPESTHSYFNLPTSVIVMIIINSFFTEFRNIVC